MSINKSLGISLGLMAALVLSTVIFQPKTLVTQNVEQTRYSVCRIIQANATHEMPCTIVDNKLAVINAS